MEQLKIRVRFSDIHGISDRTARTILKDMSQLCRRVHMREVEAVMRAAHLNRRERQSLRDRLQPEIVDGPAYYLERLEEGSIELLVILGGVGLWVLQATLGETLKSAWKETRTHNAIVDWTKSRREKKVPLIIAEEAEKQDFLGGRAVVDKATLNGSVVEITLRREEYEEIHRTTPITEQDVLQRGETLLDQYRRR